MRERWLVVVTATLLGLALFALPGLSDTGWREIAGSHSAGGDRVDFVLRYRNLEAHLTQSRSGRVEFLADCVGRRLTETHGDPPYTVARDADTEQQCFDWASGSILGFGRLRTVAGDVSLEARAGVPVIVLSQLPAAVDWIEITLASETNLPLAATSRAGLEHQWEYLRIDYAASPLESRAFTGVPDEQYRSMTIAEVQASLELPAGGRIPATIGRLPFATAFSYVGGEVKDGRYYAIWNDGATDQVQLVVSPGTLPPNTPTVEDLGPTAKLLNIQDADQHWQIFASNSTLLNEAAHAIRPDFSYEFDFLE